MPHHFKRAGECLSTLYRYRPFDFAKDFDATQKGYLADTLTTGRIWVANATTLNDPWEFSPDLVPDGNGPDGATQLAQFLDFLAPGPAEELPRVIDAIRTLGEEAVLQRCREILFRSIHRHGVVSFSSRADLFLQWSYYAAGHNGYALVYDAKMLPFSEAMQIRYQRAHPRVLLTRRDMSGLAGELLATKAREWVREREWRLIVVPELAVDRLGFKQFDAVSSKGYYGHLPAARLVGIVLGDRLLSGENGNTVIELVRRHQPTLPITHAQIDRHAFRINLRPVM